MNNDSAKESTFADIYEERSESFSTLKMYHLLEQQIHRIEPLLAELEGLWPTMPKVESNGVSDCPFAEDQYLTKQRLERQVSTEIGGLRRVMGDIDSEIARCKRNLTRISVDAQQIELAATRSKYAEGMGRQEQEYTEAQGMRRELEEVISRAEATLAASQKKRYPLPLPKDSLPGALSATASTFPPTPNDIRDEVNDLISMGRM